MSAPATDAAAPAGGCAAVLLAGGRGSRMGGVHKPLLEVGGRSLLQLAIDAAEALGCSPVTVAGPVADAVGAHVRWVREQPPLGGPAAGIVAALAEPASAPEPAWTLVLACDQPAAPAAALRLRDGIEALPAGLDGRCLAVGGRAQWLCGLYRTSALRSAAAALPESGAGASMRMLLARLALELADAPAALAADVDTWDDLEQARARADAARATEDSQEEAP
ncbi:Molybdopterin-guanine dinucleotide biosynthesis protein A [Agrococcus baldri]|uniref:Molybdopterin-guanine dinucleotide biosynthesis protein A n=1 Tax=Agrococcus baldri TaxID=153730 RepID=A0AA94HL68_9MICO|nr:NTP transferase domain-containing protein [Agrococcus baldri]SFS03721.1 Molybdopterin-guanine dinucleotide biosynthesis protein A [Agrococcus baldri]